MIILDTNVLSALMRPAPDRAVMSWPDHQPRVSVWTTAITVLELQFGIELLGPSRRRAALCAGLDRMCETLLEGRILVFDDQAALSAGRLMAD